MNCVECREEAMEMARGRAASMGAVTHMEACPDCARLFENQTRLSEGLGAMAAFEIRGPSAALELALLNQLRTARPVRRWKAVAIAGTAAAAIVAAGIALAVALGPMKREVPIAKVESKTPVLTAAAPVREEVAMAAPVAHHARRHVHRVPAPVSSADLDFVALPDALPFETGERAEMVRVSVPVGVLANWGFAVAPSDPGRLINADVVIGENGLARAVRLVR